LLIGKGKILHLAKYKVTQENFTQIKIAALELVQVHVNTCV